jgi:hypothetical protein
MCNNPAQRKGVGEGTKMYQETSPDIIKLGFLNLKRIIKPIYRLVIRRWRFVRFLVLRASLIAGIRVLVVAIADVRVVGGLLLRLKPRLAFTNAFVLIVVTRCLTAHDCIP